MKLEDLKFEHKDNERFCLYAKVFIGFGSHLRIYKGPFLTGNLYEIQIRDDKTDEIKSKFYTETETQCLAYVKQLVEPYQY